MGKKLILQILTVLLFFSCTHKGVEIKEEGGVTVDLDHEKEISLYDLFSRVEIIPLETTSESIFDFSRLGEMRVHNGNYYVSAKKQNAIWQFDENGRFVKCINHYGDGPGEYIDLADFRFNRFTDDLEILCTRCYINVYDSSGEKFKKRISLPEETFKAVHQFVELSPTEYILFAEFREGKKMLWYDVVKGEIIAENYDIPSFILAKTFYHHSFTPFYVFNDTVHFVQGYNGDVFVADSVGGLKPKYQFDFGKYNFDISELKIKEESIEFYMHYAQTTGAKYANSFIAYGENEKYYMSRFKYQKRIHHLLLNKKTGEAYSFKKLKEGCFCFPLCVDERHLYFIAMPQELPAFINPEVLSDEDQKKFYSVSLDDNPIVIKYTFK